MGVTNLDGSEFDTHVKQIADYSVEAIEAANKVLIDEEHPEKGTVQIRVGFHSGPVVSNVIGVSALCQLLQLVQHSGRFLISLAFFVRPVP